MDFKQKLERATAGLGVVTGEGDVLTLTTHFYAGTPETPLVLYLSQERVNGKNKICISDKGQTIISLQRIANSKISLVNNDRPGLEQYLKTTMRRGLPSAVFGDGEIYIHIEPLTKDGIKELARFIQFLWDVLTIATLGTMMAERTAISQAQSSFLSQSRKL